MTSHKIPGWLHTKTNLKKVQSGKINGNTCVVVPVVRRSFKPLRIRQEKNKCPPHKRTENRCVSNGTLLFEAKGNEAAVLWFVMQKLEVCIWQLA